MSEATMLPNSTYERDIYTLPVTVKFPNVAVDAVTPSKVAESLDIELEVIPCNSSCVWEADANAPPPAETTADAKSDISEEEWECPSSDTAMPFTVMADAQISSISTWSKVYVAYKSSPR